MPKPGEPHDQMNLTVRTQLSTLLLRLSWSGYPLYNSKEFGWVFRVPIEDADVMDPDEESRLAFTQGQEALEQQNEERAERQEEEEEAEEAEAQGEKKTRKKAAAATKKEHPDIILHRLTRDGETSFFKVPHPNGDQARVGSMIAKSSIKHIEDGVLTSVYPEAREAIQMNAQCSYWVSARSRVLEQMAVQESQSVPMGFASANSSSSPSPSSSRSTPPAPSPSTITPLSPKGSGIILPHVIVMGTITRRAIEKTWLTASNAKKNRVGSELKAMVKAPDGYAIVGADVDSEELWIAGLMGDAQFGLHGGSAIGWMTLEGTKSAGTDVHSKTAAIVGTSRDIAKIFNYSRIYGAGVNYAARLLLDSMKTPDEELAKSKADDLYAATKGKKIDRRSPNFHQFWHGGSESYLFNAIESVSRRLRPSTPALRCGITTALQEDYLEHSTAHMTSRINWVVQSSGVDYLHLLIVAMGHLCQTYDINARYLISVHDEVRYLVKKEDQERASLALQIANLWTRSLFAYKLGMDDLPQGCAFFSAVDIDSVLRKEVDMPCITPSNPTPVPPGETLDILQSIERTGGTLHKDRSPMTSSPSSPSSNAHSPTSAASSPSITLPPRPYSPPRANTGITPSANWPSFFLKAQAEQDDDKIDELWEKVGRPSDKTRAMYTARDRRKMFGSASPFQAGWKK
jgi:DNA polymerase gamma 1